MIKNFFQKKSQGHSEEQTALSSEVKAVSMKCLNQACKESIVLGDNKELYLCTNLNKKLAECQHLTNKNLGRVSPLSLLDRELYLKKLNHSFILILFI